jgi:glycosyltransferase involved in cell wall biosynthesis
MERIHPIKGLDILVNAFLHVIKQNPEIHLLLAGDDETGYESEVRKWVEANGIRDKVMFTGMIEGEAKKKFY